MTTLNELVDDINNLRTDEYQFLKILSSDDIAKFVAKIPEKYYNDIFIRKKIPLDLWLMIVKNLKSNTEYKIFRRAYDGENRGKRRINNQISTKFVVSLWSIYSDEKTNFFDMLIDPFKRKNNQKLILLSDDKMHEIDFTSRNYFLSSWENYEYSSEIADIFLNQWF